MNLKINKLIKILIVISGFTFFVSCEDIAPTEYTPSYIVQALLLVDQPIKDIYILQSLSLRDSFIYDNSFLKNCTVQITGENRQFDLLLNADNNSYYFPDTAYKVKPLTEYKLKVILEDGKTITGKTFTPNSFEWMKIPPAEIPFPKDTLNPPSTFQVSWTKTDTIKYYILSILALDTLNYGKYLSPPTEELNRRIIRPWNEERKYYFRDQTSWGFAPSTDIPVIWNFFKWFGWQELTVYAPDDNFLKWSLQVFSFREMEPQLTTVEGAFGYFGSAAIIKTKSFLVKNQP